MDRVHCCTLFMLLSLAILGERSEAADASPGPNYAHGSEIHSLLHWEHFPLHVYFGTGASSEGRATVLAGFEEWAHATHGVVCWQLVTAADQADITVVFTSQPVVSGSPTTIGQTFVTSDGSVIHQASIHLTEQGDDSAELKALSAHEFGHALGIEGHSDDSDDIMYPIVAWSSPEVWNAEHQFVIPTRIVTLRDINTLKAAYPASVFPPEKH